MFGCKQFEPIVMNRRAAAKTPYAARIDQLRNGTGGVPKVDATTVLDDGADDMLFGNQGLDWFFAGEGDGPVDQRPEEQASRSARSYAIDRLPFWLAGV
jgi:hypothetical protein